MKTITLTVKGMHCPSCEMLVTESLEDEGVTGAKASFKEERVEVSFDEDKLTEAKIRTIIEKEGYKVK